MNYGPAPGEEKPWASDRPSRIRGPFDPAPQEAPPAELGPQPVHPQSIKRPSHRLHLILFVATILTTLLAGALMRGANPLQDPGSLALGIPFSFTLMAILLTHEMGHYLTARWYGVPASLPYFIPAPPIPFIIGTFGAFIRMESSVMTRKATLEIGAAGPLAGFVVAVIAVAVGLQLSEIVPVINAQGVRLGSPLVFIWISDYLMVVPEGHDVLLHPVAFAGWIGLFVTALNLIPIGQLDGGHVVFALFGRHHRRISIAMVVVLAAIGLTSWPGWLFWAFLTAMMGVGHPPMAGPQTRLERRQHIIGWASLALFILTFTPNPFM